MRFDWFGATTVDDIVSGLGDMVKRLEHHAADKLSEAQGHLDRSRHHNEHMHAANAAAERASVIAGKIGALVR